MRYRILILVGLMAFMLNAAAQDKSTGKDGATAEAKQPKASEAKDKKKAPEEKRITDKDGKTYVLRSTPFGTVKVEDKPKDPKEDEPPERMRAYEDGDNIRFESTTPFGVARWVRKKTELNETEKAVWERELRNKAAKEPEPKKEGK